MLKPLEQFICDTCHGVIEKPEDGWVEWLGYYENHKPRNTEFRVCHHKSRCMVLANHKNVSDGHLHTKLQFKSFVLQLLDMLSSPHHTAHPEDVPGITEMLRRFTIPYYDEARQYLNEENYTDPYDLIERNLKAIILENE